MADSEHLILPNLKFKVVVLIIIGLLCVSGAVLAESSASGGYGPYDHIFPQIDISRDQQKCSVSINGTCPLYIALMMSFGDEFDSRGVIPGVQMAIQHINDDPSMLLGYSLHYVLKATQCETYGISALDALHTHLLQPPTKIGIIGSGCSLATEATAQVSHYYNLTHISCVSASVELSNRERFRYYFQLLATEADLAFGFYGIIRHFRWRRVVILLQEERLFEVTMNRLVDLLKSDEQRIEVRVKRFNSSSCVAGLGDHPFDPDYRIIVFAMFSKHARRLLCKASEQGIHYPRYEFIFYGWYAENWWRDEEETLQSLYNNNCSAAQRERVIGPALSPVQDEFISDCSKVADSGINGSIFQEEYQSFLKRSMNSPLNIKTQLMYAQHCYDATWTLARALNSTIEDIQDVDVLMKLREFSQQDFQNDPPTDTEFALQHFTYNNSAVLDLIYGHLNETLFNGITGKIFFESSDGIRRVPKIVVYQYRLTQDSECFTCLCPNTSLQYEKTLGRQPIATIENENFTFRLLINEDELWTNGVPYDGIPREVVEKIHPAVTIIFCGMRYILY